jgi:threonine dehydrogenase-like Zn-dependent dehydrogenase
MFFTGPTARYLHPVILGHELCAEVVQAGPSVDGYDSGDLVAVAPVIPCNRCYNCSRGQDNICEQAGVVGCNLHGGMAEYLYLPGQMVLSGGVVKLPAGVDCYSGALAEVVGCCLHGWRQAGLAAGDRVVILGGGPIGLAFLQLAKLMGAGWVGITGRRLNRLSLAHELGADEVIDIAKDDLLEICACAGQIDRVIVANSSVQALEDALRVVRPGGSILLFSGYLPGTTMKLNLNDIHYREIHLHSSIDCTIRDFQNAVSLLPQLAMQKLVTSLYPLDQVVQAFQATRDPQAVKVMFDLSD